MGGDWLGFYKYKLAAFRACHLDQELPPVPAALVGSDDPRVLVGGRLDQYWNLIKRTDKARFREILATLAKVKGAMPRPPKAALDKAIADTFVKLTTAQPLQRRAVWRELDPQRDELDWDIEDRGTEVNAHDMKDVMVAEIRRTVKEVFGSRRFTWRDAVTAFVPSANANVETTRAEGGAIGHIMEHEVMQGLQERDEKLIVQLKDFAGNVGIEDHVLTDRFRMLYERVVQCAVKEEKKVTLVALPEALKVRVISKGPVMTYTCLKPLQRWLWKSLKEHKSGTFRLIGEPVTEEFMMQQLGKLREGESYMSGDYKDATNELKSWASKAATDAIGELIEDPRIRALFEQALVGHLIRDGKSENFKLQTNGQLMGSVVSFPILCIVNAAVNRLAREGSVGRSLRLEDANIAINGDDCAARLTRVGYARWKFFSSLVGLKPSIGKTWFSREFVELNSTQFTCAEGKDHFLSRVRQINVGLLNGMGRTTTLGQTKVNVHNWGTLNSVSRNAHTLVSECAEQDRLRVFKMYLTKNHEMLRGRKVPLQLPWFLPEHLGGLGLPTFPDYKVRDEKTGVERAPFMPTDVDLRLASAFFQHGQLPSKKPEGLSWKIWDYAQDRLKDFKPTDTSRIISVSDPFGRKDPQWEVISESQLMGELCVEALFSSTFEGLYAKEQNTKCQTLRRIEKAIAKVKPYMSKCEPFQPESLPKPADVVPDRRFFKMKTSYYVTNHSPEF